MRRRTFLKKATASAAAGLLTSGLSGAEADAGGNGRPNVLVILTDQQHAGMLSCAGNPWLKTPNMDRIAANGVRFEKAYAANPVCVPSRFAMFTGNMPSAIGMEDNADIRNEVSRKILDNAMGNIFRRAGYKTVYGGKIHLPGPKGIIDDVGPYGFDYITPDDREGRDKLADACVEFLGRKHEKPFLMVASFINPHDICYMAIHAERAAKEGKVSMPIDKARHWACLDAALKMPEGVSEKEFFDRHCPSLPENFGIQQDEPEGLASLDFRPFRKYIRENWTEKDWRLHRWAYARLTERVDAKIGLVLDALEKTGLVENTIVVFLSDHGDMDASHRLEHKTMPYEEAMRVPFIVSWKGVTRAGAVDREHLVSSGLDLIPTICDMAGIPVPAELKGNSLRKQAMGETVSDWRKSIVVENEESRILHMGDRKYAVYAAGVKREQFMDLVKDPGEMKNVAYDPVCKPRVLEARELLKEWYVAHGLKMDSKYIMEEAL